MVGHENLGLAIVVRIHTSQCKYEARQGSPACRQAGILGAKESIKRTAKIAEKVIAEGDFLAGQQMLTYAK